MSDKQTTIHALPLTMSGLIPFKNAVRKGLDAIDKALPAPFVAEDAGKLASIVSDEGGARTVWVTLESRLPAFGAPDIGKVLGLVDDGDGNAVLGWVVLPTP